MSHSTDIAACFSTVLGADAVESGAAVRAFRADNIVPRAVLFPTTIDELSSCLVAANEAGICCIPAGNGTLLHIGGLPHRYDVAVSTRRLQRIVAHEAADMTVTTEAGLTLGDLNAALATQGQWLPLDPPLPDLTTLGALIATDACGPVRLSHGKVRDLLIGVTAVLADGSIVKGGGRVVKNVAGYDLMKLFTGSFGTLGVIVEATFKVRPLPEHSAAWTLSVRDIGEAVGVALSVLDDGVTPLYVEIVNDLAATSLGIEEGGATVVVAAAGSAAEIGVHGERLAARRADRRAWRSCSDATQLHAVLRDWPLQRIGAGGPCTYGCKVSVLPSRLGPLLQHIESAATARGLAVAALVHVGNGSAILRVHGQRPDADVFAAFADWLRTTVTAARGWVLFDVLPAALKERIDPWGHTVPGLALMRSIKHTLDPQGRLSPGRFVAGL
jgi:glycolate oxidase FAD binding subunit